MTKVLDSRGLALFLAVAETLNFRQAAERLHMSQPPLSRAIKTMEDRLGTRLFVRDTHAVSLTDAGRQLVPRARKILNFLAETEEALTAMDGPTQLRIGVTNAIEPGWFKGLPKRIEAGRPGSSVEIVFASSPRLVRLLRLRKLDAAFVALPTETSGLQLSTLDRQPTIVAMPSAHPLARRRVVALNDLANERLFWFERPASRHSLIIAAQYSSVMRLRLESSGSRPTTTYCWRPSQAGKAWRSCQARSLT